MNAFFREKRLLLFSLFLTAFNFPLNAHDEPPTPVAPSTIIIDQSAAIRLGRALFWDQQLGGGNGAQMACASCHYQAGTDSHPMRIETGKLANDSITSLGVKFAAFNSLDCDGTSCQAIDNCNVIGGWLRTGVQAPPAIESQNVHNFGDGRANNIFNGVDSTGSVTNGIFERDSEGVINPVDVAYFDSSQASQSLPPANSSVEMACAGRTFPEIGYKLLRVVPLALQSGAVASDVQTTTYAELIAAAFDARFVGDEIITTVAPIRSGDPNNLAPQPTLTEQNFALFFGLAIQAYEQTLTYSGRVPTEDELTSMNNLGCDFCHAEGKSSAMLGGQNSQNSFVNIGVELIKGSPGVTDGNIGSPNIGLFKTSHLLNLPLTAPFFHNGKAGALDDVVDFYINGGCRGIDSDPDFCNGNAVTAETTINPIIDPLNQDINNVITMMTEMVDPQICEGSGPYAHPSLTLWIDDEDADPDITLNDSDNGDGLNYVADDGTTVNCDSLLALFDPPTLTRVAFSEERGAWRFWGDRGANDPAESVDAFLLEGGAETFIATATIETDGSFLIRVNNSPVVAVDASAGVKLITSSGAILEEFGTIEFVDN